MIKQLLSSAGSSKEAGLATNITKTAGAEGEQVSPGLFGSILKKVQEFGQQGDPETTSSKKGETQSEEATTDNETAVVETEVSGKEKVAGQEPEENEEKQEVIGAEKAGENLELKPDESEKNPEAGKGDAILTADSEGSSLSDTELATEATKKNVETAGSTNKTERQSDVSTISKTITNVRETSNSEVNIETADTTTVSETENTDQVVKPAAEQESGEVKSVEPVTPQTQASVKSGPKVSETTEGGGTTKNAASVKEIVPESEIELQESEGDSMKSSSTNNLNNPASAESLTTEAAASQKKNQKVFDQASASVNKVQKQQVTENTETNDAETEEGVDVTKQAIRAATGQTSTGAAEINQGIQSQKAEEVREKRFRENYAFSGRQELTSERLDIITQGRDTKAPVSFLSQLDVPVQAIQNQMSTGQNSVMTTEHELMLKEYLKESVEMTEQKDTSNALFARMGEMPVSNMLVRRTVMPSLTQAVQKTISAGKATPETWQKHSFELEDGNSIQLSTRQVDGVLQVKLATTSVELSRLMQQYEQEIKQHLEQECQLDVNLQFDGGEQGQEMSGFFGNPSSSRQKTAMTKSGAEKEQSTAQKTTEKNLQQTVRRFGYNQMEWTA